MVGLVGLGLCGGRAILGISGGLSDHLAVEYLVVVTISFDAILLVSDYGRWHETNSVIETVCQFLPWMCSERDESQEAWLVC